MRGCLLDLLQPAVMGIVNVTPDSFYGGSRKTEVSEIIAHVGRLLGEGASIIDLGAQSTNPQSPFIGAAEEAARLRKVLPDLRKSYPDAFFSVDTFFADVAKMCVEEYGIDMVNDISGGQIDPDMFAAVARLRVPYVLMHTRGTPQTMAACTDYGHLVQEVLAYFSEKIGQLALLGVNDVIVDPGFGFAKILEQNYELMAQLSDFQLFNRPLLVGVSRKSMIYKLLDCAAEDSLNGTTALNMFALGQGADILRVHDVKQAAEAVRIFQQLKSALPQT